MLETVTIGSRDGEALMADIFMPAPVEGNLPLIVAASGGGWRRGSRQALHAWGHYFSARGLAFASVDYARATSGPAWPRNVEDVATALRYFAANGRTHGIDAGRIGALGVSAGAHLTALALLSNAFETPAVRCFAGIYGVYDLMAHWQSDLAVHGRRGEDLTERMLGCSPYDDPQVFHDASPLRQITYAKAMPVLLSWGHNDREVSPAQSSGFAVALRQAGFPVRAREFDEAGHFWFSEEDPETPGSLSARLAPELTLFFQRSLAPADKATFRPTVAASRGAV